MTEVTRMKSHIQVLGEKKGIILTTPREKVIKHSFLARKRGSLRRPVPSKQILTMGKALSFWKEEGLNDLTQPSQVLAKKKKTHF